MNPASTKITNCCSCFLLLLVESLHYDNLILILDSISIFKTRASCACPLAKSTIKRSTKHQYKVGEMYPLDLWSSFWLCEYGQYVLCMSHNAVVARVHCWRTDRSEFLRLLCLIDCWSWWTQWEAEWKLRQAKAHRDVEQQVGSYISFVPRLLGRGVRGKWKKEPDTHCSCMCLIRAWFTTWTFIGIAKLLSEPGGRVCNDVE